MDRAADLITEHRIHQLVLLNSAETVERRAAYLRTEVVLGTGRVDDDGFGSWDRRLDAALEFFRGGHGPRVAA